MLTYVIDPNQSDQEFDFGFLNNEISSTQKSYLDDILMTLNDAGSISLTQNINDSTVNFNVEQCEDQQNQNLPYINLAIPSSSTGCLIPQSNFIFFFYQLNRNLY